MFSSGNKGTDKYDNDSTFGNQLQRNEVDEGHRHTDGHRHTEGHQHTEGHRHTGIGGKIENAVENLEDRHHLRGEGVIEKVVGTETREFPTTYYETEQVPVQREKIVNREVTEEVPVIREEARTVMVPVEDVEVRTRVVQETVPVTEYETRHVAKTKMEAREVPVIQEYVPTTTRVLEGAEKASIGQKIKDAFTTETTHTSHGTGPTQQNTHTGTTVGTDHVANTTTTGQKPSLIQKVKNASTHHN